MPEVWSVEVRQPATFDYSRLSKPLQEFRERQQQKLAARPPKIDWRIVDTQIRQRAQRWREVCAQERMDLLRTVSERAIIIGAVLFGAAIIGALIVYATK